MPGRVPAWPDHSSPYAAFLPPFPLPPFVFRRSNSAWISSVMKARLGALESEPVTLEHPRRRAPCGRPPRHPALRVPKEQGMAPLGPGCPRWTILTPFRGMDPGTSIPEQWVKQSIVTLQVSRPSFVEGRSCHGDEALVAAEVPASRQWANVGVSAPGPRFAIEDAQISAHPAFVSCYDCLRSPLAGSHQSRYQRLASEAGRSKRNARTPCVSSRLPGLARKRRGLSQESRVSCSSAFAMRRRAPPRLVASVRGSG